MSIVNRLAAMHIGGQQSGYRFDVDRSFGFGQHPLDSGAGHLGGGEIHDLQIWRYQCRSSNHVE